MKPADVKQYYEGYVQAHPYEKQRWFRDALQQAGYDMTRNFVTRVATQLRPDAPSSVLELGPGPGTWTDVLQRIWHVSPYHAVEISNEMASLFTVRFHNDSGVTLFRQDILTYLPSRSYQFFFSSRVIEYVPDKQELFSRVYQWLEEGGEGVVITKTPKYLFDRLRGRHVSDFHSGMISHRELCALLRRAGFQVVGVYAVTATVPLMRLPWLNTLCWKVLQMFPHTVLTSWLTESYGVHFKKP